MIRKIDLSAEEWEYLYFILWDYSHENEESQFARAATEAMKQLREQALNPLEER